MEDLFEPVTRTSLSQEARRQILQRIADGRLAPESRVSELDLAPPPRRQPNPPSRSHGLSRQRWLAHQPGRRGWRVAPLTDVDAREIYPILAILSSLALALQESSILGSLEPLSALAARVGGASAVLGSEDRMTLEEEWDAALPGGCPHRTLVDMLRVLQVRAYRLERASVRQGWRRPPGELEGVVRCLVRVELRQACRTLEMHWRDRGESIVSWLGRQRPPDTPERVA